MSNNHYHSGQWMKMAERKAPDKIKSAFTCPNCGVIYDMLLPISHQIINVPCRCGAHTRLTADVSKSGKITYSGSIETVEKE